MTPAEFKNIRLGLGLTQAQMALALGYAPKYGNQHIYKIEKGIKRPSRAVVKLMEILSKHSLSEG